MKRFFLLFSLFLIVHAQTFSQKFENLSNKFNQELSPSQRKKIKERYQKLLPSQKKLSNIYNKFSYLEKKDTNDYLFFLEKKVQNICINPKYNSNHPYLTTQEIEKLKKISLEYLQTAEYYKKHGFTFLFFLTSSSVPNYTIANWMLETAILEKAGFNIFPIVYIRGFGKNFKKYMFNLAHTMNKIIPKEYKPYVKTSFRLKLGPQFFEYFKLKRVPAIVFAKCKDFSPIPSECDIKYLMRGDADLSYFFEKITNVSKNPIYEKCHQVLIANKIVNYNNKQIKSKNMLK